VLGLDSTEYILNCVDDIIVYSKTFEEHIKRLDEIGKLTSAGL
jgi:siroheme synthase (precorrin-2 oxidase/ferrochelatase)